MIKQFFYSTLNDEYYESKTEAEKAEDKIIDDYFKELDRKIAVKRRKELIEINKNKLKKYPKF